jgi:hypothetical protein
MHPKLIILILVLAFSANAATYYVATNGNDTAAGSQGAPWATLAKAAGVVNAGDTVIIANGYYGELITLSRHGALGNPIQWQGESLAANVKRFTVNANHNIITNLTIGPPVGVYDWGVKFGAASRSNELVGCRFDYNGLVTNQTSGGVWVDGTNNVVRACQFFRMNQNTVIDLHGTGNLVTRCVATNHNAVDFCRAFGWNNTVSFNEYAHATYTSGNHPDFIQTFGDNYDSATNIVIEGNYVHDAVTQLCHLERTHDAADIHTFVFRNNVFANIESMGFTYVPHTKFYNNVFYRVGYGNGDGAMILGWSVNYPDGGGATSNELKNNVFLECGTSPGSATKGWWYVNTARGGALTVLSDYNYFGGTGYAAKTGFPDVHAVNGGDPKLASTNTFTLLAGSPLIDAGTNLTSFTTDKAGNTRPAGSAWDIGAYELIGGGALAPPSKPAWLQQVR